jgi:hypothetical protein
MPKYQIPDKRPEAKEGDWLLKVDTETDEIEFPDHMSKTEALGLAIEQSYHSGLLASYREEGHHRVISILTNN